MTKITLDSVASGYDLSKINTNFQTIATAFENTLSRDGTTPNTLEADLDANGNDLYNVGTINGVDFTLVVDLDAAVTAAEASATAAALSETNAATSESNAALSASAASQSAIDAAASAATITPVEEQIHAATGKTTPVDADEFGLVDSEATWSLKKLTWANLKATLKTYFDTLYQVAGTYLTPSDIGSSVQGYDADTAKLDVHQTWTGAQRGTITTDNDGSFDQSVTNNFKCTPTGAVAITFTNHTAGQSGQIIYINGSNYATTAAATTYISAVDLVIISVTGTYLISYLDDGTNAYCVVSAALTSAGV